jgi:hypothetical protein
LRLHAVSVFCLAVSVSVSLAALYNRLMSTPCIRSGTLISAACSMVGEINNERLHMVTNLSNSEVDLYRVTIFMGYSASRSSIYDNSNPMISRF